MEAGIALKLDTIESDPEPRTSVEKERRSAERAKKFIGMDTIFQFGEELFDSE